MSATEFQKNLLKDDPYKDEVDVAGDVMQPPSPGSEVAGPAMFDLVREVKQAQLVGQALLKSAFSLLDKRTIVRQESGQTDGSGNVDIPLFTVPQGFEFVVTRVNVESPAFTPATPFSSATGWIALARGAIIGGPGALGPGAILDFLPNPPVATGAILPALFTDGQDQAAILRGGETISLHFFGGGGASINIDIYCRLQGFTRAL
jgi:hypothetical protein